MSLNKEKRPIHGILLLNKPKGISSNAALQKVKHLFRAKKAGHTGSLDPMATGMLPICFGEATKFSQYLLDADKSYQASALLGTKTTTADAMGELIAEKKEFTISQEELLQCLESFKGKTLQVPSMFSALKHQGRPLYALARKGIEVERQAREINISQLDLLAFDGKELQINVSCSKGTYIRNLVEDIGEQLKTYAHLTALHRTYTAGFNKDPMYTLESLEQMTEEDRLKALLPMERALINFSSIILTDSQVLALQQGRTVNALDLKGLNDLLLCENKEAQTVVSLKDQESNCLGLGEWLNSNELKGKRLLALKEGS